MLVREFLTIQMGLKRRVKTCIENLKKGHTLLSLSMAQCPGYMYTLFSINAQTHCKYPSPMLSWKTAIWSKAMLCICLWWCDRQSTNYINDFIKVSNRDITGKWHTHLPIHLTKLSSFDIRVFNALYCASCFPSLSSILLAHRTLTTSSKTSHL